MVCACRFGRVSYVHYVLHDEMLIVNGVIGAIFEMHLGNRFYYFAHNMENSDVMVSREMYIFSKLSVLLISNILEIYTTFILRIWICEFDKLQINKNKNK